MFTGIVTAIGHIAAIERAGVTRFTVATPWNAAGMAVGASVAHSGACLTIVAMAPGTHAVEASAETLAKTTLGEWREGTEINLERSLRLGDELGGHLVCGHVDGVATIVDRRPDGDSVRFVVEVPDRLAGFVAPKGSVALDGVSLTVNEVVGNRFGINLIPHTLACTTFRTSKPGHRLNFEADMLARYVARLTAWAAAPGRAIPA
jgi:riboflavin synthase